MVYRFHHIHLICKDLKKMVDFFLEVLGATLIAKRKFGTADGASLDLKGFMINLREKRADEEVDEGASKTRYGYDHIGLRVDDIDAAYGELTGKGFSFVSPPQASGDLRFAFFRGPEGITVELIQTAT